MKLARGLLFYAAVWAGVLSLGIPLLLLSLLTRQPKLVFRFIPYYIGFLYRFAGVRVRIAGRASLAGGKSFLFLSNHQSFLDIPLLFAVRDMSFLAKIEIRRWPLFGLCMDYAHCIFVDRADPRSRASIGPVMLANIQKGIDYCVFPEGTRSPDGSLLPFKMGIFKIARTSGIPIVPITIHDTTRILPKRSLRMTPGVIHCTVHPPLDPAAFANLEALQVRVREIVETAMREGWRDAP